MGGTGIYFSLESKMSNIDTEAGSLKIKELPQITETALLSNLIQSFIAGDQQITGPGYF